MYGAILAQGIMGEGSREHTMHAIHTHLREACQIQALEEEYHRLFNQKSEFMETHWVSKGWIGCKPNCVNPAHWLDCLHLGPVIWPETEAGMDAEIEKANIDLSAKENEVEMLMEIAKSLLDLLGPDARKKAG